MSDALLLIQTAQSFGSQIPKRPRVSDVSHALRVIIKWEVCGRFSLFIQLELNARASLYTGTEDLILIAECLPPTKRVPR